MKTYPTHHTTTYNTSLASLITSKLGNTGRIRVAQVGAGVVILPETNCTQELSENEMRKALHIEEKASKEKTVKIKLYSQSSWDDMEPCYLELTEEQYRLFDWLFKNQWFFDDATFEENPGFEFEKI